MDREGKGEDKEKSTSENRKLLTPQQKQEIKKAFDFFDVTGSGK
jgi:Ca2+-binding EF-hand superfamily protein